MAVVFPELGPRDRAALCRVLAYEARRGVDATTGAARDEWVSVERLWKNLARKADEHAAAESLTLLELECAELHPVELGADRSFEWKPVI